MHNSVAAGTEAETNVIRFQKWLITKMHDDLPSVKIIYICDKEQGHKKIDGKYEAFRCTNIN